jgi:protein-disulfide isomerase
LLAKPIPLPTEPTSDNETLGQKARGVLKRAGAVASELNERADLSGRVEKLDMKARMKTLGDAGAKIAASGSAIGGVAARKAKQAVERAGSTAGPKIRSAATSARSAISEGAARAGAGLRKLPGSINETTADKAARIPSSLDKLMATDNGTRSSAAREAESADLPLFRDEPQTVANGPVEHETRPTVRPTEAATAQPSTAAIKSTVHASGEPARPATPAVRAVSTSGWLRHPATMALGAACLLSSGIAIGQWWSGGSSVTPESVRAAVLADPSIVPAAMEKLAQDRTAASLRELGSAVTRPFSGAWAGNADGDVTLVVFTDYACTFCRASMPDIDRLLREDRELKVVFRELPILSADSEAAARLALAAAQRGRYMPMHRGLFTAERPDAAARIALAERLATPADNMTLNASAITRELQNNLSMARALGFDGTPSWVVGDRVLNGAVGYDQLRAAIATARE